MMYINMFIKKKKKSNMRQDIEKKVGYAARLRTASYTRSAAKSITETDIV